MEVVTPFQVEGFEEAVKQIIGVSRSSQTGVEAELWQAGKSRFRFSDSGVVFPGPGLEIRSRKSAVKVDLDRDLECPAGAGTKPEATIRLALARDDEHHGPIAGAEDPAERLLVDMAGLSRIAGVRVDPNPSELLWPASKVNLVVKELGNV